MLLGLNYLHATNFIHRDIKSPNILLDEHGVAKIGDVGMTTLVTCTAVHSSNVVGACCTAYTAYHVC